MGTLANFEERDEVSRFSGSRRASGCELSESSLNQDGDGGVFPFLGGVEGSAAIARPSHSNSKAGIRSRCEKSTNNIDVATTGCPN